MSEDMSKYRDAFLSEAQQHISSMESALLRFEKDPARTETVNAVFHAAHTLKAVAATMDYAHMAALCHAVEDVLDAVKNKKMEPDRCIDPLLEGIDVLRRSLRQIAAGGEELDTTGAVARLNGIAIAGRVPEEGGAGVPVAPEISRVESISVKVERLDTLVNLAEELLISKMTLDSVTAEMHNARLAAAIDSLGRQIADLQYNVMQSRLVPVGFVFDRFPRMVRDLAKSQGKQVELEVAGLDLELDRAVIDEIGEGLVHLLRNAVDHGIETPEDRRAAGKPEQGRIVITAGRTKEFAIIEVADDGQGLAVDEIREAAIRNQLVSPLATTEELIQSIFFGVSTTETVTAVSGRGLGLNIVKRKIESLGGAVRVESEPGKGTMFTLEIPLTLAVIKALLVTTGGNTYAIPLSKVEKLVTVDKTAVKGFMDHEALLLNDDNVPITRLNALFDVPSAALREQPMVIVGKGLQRLALAVDAFVTTQEVVVRPLNKLVRNSRYFSGSTVLGSGEVVLILDVANLAPMKRSRCAGAWAAAERATSESKRT